MDNHKKLRCTVLYCTVQYDVRYRKSIEDAAILIDIDIQKTQRYRAVLLCCVMFCSGAATASQRFS
jgi:hypothetical protein